ncbi:MAG TPA: fumarylacetoacetate hydrolase family protein [Alphaproteobacteria bacterium]|jgi:2-keto-4-pentenoate hydratase|nr:fumarylacetoacetate hydrolase family protein [Alphaproteobacteria bacterium]
MFDANAAANYLIGQRKPDAILAGALPEEFRPQSLQDAIAVQMATMAVLGPIGGWKVGAANATAEPSASPLALSGICKSPGRVQVRTRIAECEIGFTFAKALPPRGTPYTADEVLAAIGTCQPTIEAVDPRFISPSGLDQLTILADCGMHGGLVVGTPIAEWRPEMFAALHVVSTVNGAPQREAVGSNPGGTDLMRLLVWLTNSEVVRAAGGLAAGAVVTTGSWTGADPLPPGAHVVGRFDGFAPVEATFT